MAPQLLGVLKDALTDKQMEILGARLLLLAATQLNDLSDDLRGLL